MADPYPLTFEPILKEKVWGGRRLGRYGKLLRDRATVGESWEIADLASTSPGGGGGGAARSVIRRGPLAGRTLHEAMELWGEGLLGKARPSAEGGFPLLVKFLDASEHLSVQVHPSAAYCREHPGAHLKSEAWVVAEAEAHSVIFKGLAPGVARAELRRAIDASGDVAALLRRHEARPGDCHDVPSGTVHALGAGVLVLEVQTASDTTFRLYDWTAEYRREPRELHVEQALACLEEGPPPPTTCIAPGGHRLVASEHFDLWGYDLAAGGDVSLDWAQGRCVGVVVLSGAARLDGPHQGVALGRGGVALLPAAVVEPTRVVAEGASRVVCFGVGAAAA